MKDLKKAIITFFELTCKPYTDLTLNIWYDELKKYDKNKTIKALLKLSKSTGFISIGNILDEINEKPDFEQKSIGMWQDYYENYVLGDKLLEKDDIRRGILRQYGSTADYKTFDVYRISEARRSFVDQFTRKLEKEYFDSLQVEQKDQKTIE